jgi:ATP-binding cassette subfamily C (CFTR/MRP) protein 1
MFLKRYYTSLSRQLKRLESSSRSPIFSFYGETLSGVEIIRSFSVEKQFIQRFQLHVNDNLCLYYPDIDANRWLAFRLDLIGNLFAFFATIFCILSRNSISGGAVGVSLSFALNVI